MSLQLPKLQFHRDRYITLNEGFDRVGRFMFPEEWTGREASAWPRPDPDDLRQEKAQLEDAFKRRQQHARELRRTSRHTTWTKRKARELAEQQDRGRVRNGMPPGWNWINSARPSIHAMPMRWPMNAAARWNAIYAAR